MILRTRIVLNNTYWVYTHLARMKKVYARRVANIKIHEKTGQGSVVMLEKAANLKLKKRIEEFTNG